MYNMKIINVKNELDYAEFAEKAAQFFLENPCFYTFTESDIEPGELLAIRWNPSTVLICKIDAEFELRGYPTNQFFREELPPLNL